MATKKRRPASSRKKAIAVSTRKPTRAHLLVIECDSRKLASQGLHVGTAFGQFAQKLFTDKRIVVVQTSTEDKLRDDLARVFQAHGRFRSVLIVGHSDPTVLALTSDKPPSPWAVVAQWLRIFEPEFLFLAACEAGQSVAVRDVFKGIPGLRQIYASPVLLYKSHVAPLGVLICMLLSNGRINSEQSQALRIVHHVVYGGQLYRWVRKESGPGQELKGALWDAVSSAINFGPRDLLDRLWPMND
jgi:hypothetical protein